MKRKKRKGLFGLSLPEMLITLGLSAVVLLVGHKLVQSTLQFYRDTNDSVDVQREALFGLSQLVFDLVGSRWEQVLTADDFPTVGHDTILFPHPANTDGQFAVDAEGRILWQSRMAYFALAQPDGTHSLVKAWDDVGVPATDPGLAMAGWTAAAATTGPLSKVMARRIVLLDFDSTTDTDLVTVTLKVELHDRKKTSLQLSTKVFPRN